jgi:hypothetical protein
MGIYTCVSHVHLGSYNFTCPRLGSALASVLPVGIEDLPRPFLLTKFVAQAVTSTGTTCGPDVGDPTTARGRRPNLRVAGPEWVR